MLEKKEILYFILAGLVIGYIFSFKELISGNFLLFLKLSGLGFLTVLASSTACEFAAAKFGCDAEFKLWNLDIRFRKKNRFGKTAPWFVPSWLIFPVILAIATWGWLKWLALVVFEATPAARVHKTFVDVTDWELALIALTGPFVSLLLAIIAQLFGWKTFATMNILYALFNLLPFQELNGAKILFGSMMLWIFISIFAITIFILLGIANIITTLIAAGILAVIGMVLFYYLHEAR